MLRYWGKRKIHLNRAHYIPEGSWPTLDFPFCPTQDRFGDANRLEPAASFVVYDRSTGEILQVQHFSAMAGATVPAIEKLCEMALQKAVQVQRRDPSAMDVLQISPHEMKAGTSYRVSIKEKKLTDKPAASEKGA